MTQTWSVEELDAHACFVVRDDSGQKLAHVFKRSNETKPMATKADGSKKPSAICADPA
jgi:hypothetical protein